VNVVEVYVENVILSFVSIASACFQMEVCWSFICFSYFLLAGPLDFRSFFWFLCV